MDDLLEGYTEALAAAEGGQRPRRADARGGAKQLLTALAAFFASHGNNAATARRLNLSVRAVAYQLDRVRRLTGYSPTEPTQRFTLEAAVLGARLLDWPRQALD